MSKIPKCFVNRNPRNLEFLRLKPQNSGWGLEKDRNMKSFTYKAVLSSTSQHTSGSLIHYGDGVIISVSTRDPSISSQLYSNVDTAAAFNIGRTLAQKIQDSGIKCCVMGIEAEELERSSRKQAFFKALQHSGIFLQQSPVIPHSVINDPKFTWRHYPVQHNRQDKLDELFDSQ